ncbi:CRISPR-associated protein Csx11 [Methanocaldococcus infernus]|nr:CRISPR-associated protein Csx11 [Methanocaldococcus infernus]
MSKLEKLRDYKDEILKAEIGALLFNLGKTHIGFGFWRKYFPDKASEFKFSSYKEYAESYFYRELEEISLQLKNFFENININLGFWNTEFLEVLKGGESRENFVKKIFFRGCENINSGIDKGSPNKQLEPPLWLSNAFGSYKRIIDSDYFDCKRRCFFDALNNFLEGTGNKQNQRWNEIREFIFDYIKEWYSKLLSDSRFPINDVSLWDQAYMTASMFKAVLAQLVMDNSKLEKYMNNPSSIKWRILGIQYDKLGLAEKGLKVAHIQFYRKLAEEIDNEIKNLLEVKYPIGNEIYRDETGIYFLVGEDLGDDLNDRSNLVKLKEDYKELEDKILKIFKEKTEDEFYPAIFLTEASRGLMNLGYLLEKAKENFLKADLSKKDKDLCLLRTVKGRAVGVCQVCGTRLVYENREYEEKICETCYKRRKGRIDNWINNLEGETIWIDELKDNNNNIALITLKFELQDWLNGNMLNSLLGNRGLENYDNELKKIKELIRNGIIEEEKNRILNYIENYSDLNNLLTLKNELENFTNNTDNIKNVIINELKNTELKKLISSFISFFNSNNVSDCDYVKEKIDLLMEKLNKIRTSNELFHLVKKLTENMNLKKEKELKIIVEDLKEINEKISNIHKKLLNVNDLDKELEKIQNNDLKLIIKKLSEINICYNKITKDLIFMLYPFTINKELLNYYKKYDSIYDFFEKIFFGSIIGTQWENWINQTSLNEKIDWQNEKIKWDKLTNEDIEFLAELILQFLLRKNPSPARLRRIWENTQEFFEELEKNIVNILNIPEWRRKRLIFELDKNIPEGEYEYKGVLFWAKNKKLYLISSIEDFLRTFVNEKVKDMFKDLKKNNEEANRKILDYINTKLKEKEFNFKLIELNKKEDKEVKAKIISIKEYKPYFSIIKPTPISWQFIIPAEYVPNLIDNIMRKYDENFKFVYGKLPLHIGIIVQYYKSPLYIGIKALRKIRRDNIDIDDLYQETPIGEFCVIQRKKLANQKLEEKINNTEKYYSLYWNNKDNKEEYNFYIKPNNNWKKWISTLDKFPNNSKIYIIPNTFDFEFLETNIRRNDIFYNKNGKRVLELKSNRPYNIELHWEKFKLFKEAFSEDATKTSLHKLIEKLYDLALRRELNEQKEYVATLFINILKLNKNKELTKKLCKIFDLEETENVKEFHKYLRELNEKELKERILMFLDMFEFWHYCLGQT